MEKYFKYRGMANFQDSCLAVCSFINYEFVKNSVSDLCMLRSSESKFTPLKWAITLTFLLSNKFSQSINYESTFRSTRFLPIDLC